MTYPTNRRESAILKALRECASSTEQIGSGRWNLALANGKSLTVTARLFDEWLLLDSPLSDRVARRDMWNLLRMNATLEGLSKFVLMADNRSVHLRADVPLLDEHDLERDSDDELDGELTARLHSACAGLKAAFRSFQGETMNQHRVSTAPKNSKANGGSGAGELQSVCGDAGWPFIERSAGKFVVDLDARGGFYQATVEQRDAGAHVSVEIAQAAVAETSRQALSALLLKAGGLVRMARPSLEEKEGDIAARFEVRFDAMPTAFELTHAFSSLSVACTLCGREARSIEDEVIAREYLAIGRVAAEAREEAMLTAAD